MMQRPYFDQRSEQNKGVVLEKSFQNNLRKFAEIK